MIASTSPFADWRNITMLDRFDSVEIIIPSLASDGISSPNGKSHVVAFGSSRENLRVFAYFPQQEKTSVFSLSLFDSRPGPDKQKSSP